MSVMPTSSTKLPRLLSVLIRNCISIIGVLFLGWAAQRMAILYFADTLAGIWAALTAILYFLIPIDTAGLGDRVYNALSAALGALFIVAFIAIPLGIPLLFMMQWQWKALLDVIEQPDFIKALLGIGLTNFALSFRLYFNEVASENTFTFQSPINRHFAVLFIRWLILIIFIYIFSIFLNDFTKYFCIIIYAIATIYAELFPEQFANLIPSKQPNNWK